MEIHRSRSVFLAVRNTVVAISTEKSQDFSSDATHVNAFFLPAILFSHRHLQQLGF